MLILTWPATSPSYATIYLFILYFFALSRCSTCCVILSTKRVFCTLGPTKKKKKNWHCGPSEPSAIVLSNLAPLLCLFFTWLQPSECKKKEKHSMFIKKVDAKENRITEYVRHQKMSDVSKAALLN